MCSQYEKTVRASFTGLSRAVIVLIPRPHGPWGDIPQILRLGEVPIYILFGGCWAVLTIVLTYACILRLLISSHIQSWDPEKRGEVCAPKPHFIPYFINGLRHSSQPTNS